MRAHVIKDGKIVNTIEIASLSMGAALGLQLVDASKGGKIGDAYDANSGAPVPVEPVPAPQVVPNEVSRRRGLQALFKQYGLKDADIEAAIAEHITEPDEQYLALTEFRTSQTFERDRPLVVFMCQTLNLDRDALFIAAAKIP